MSCGQYNRGPFKETVWMQDGWTHSPNATTRLPKMIHVPFRMSKDCEFQKSDQYQLPDCVGCKLKEPNEE